MKEEHEKTGSTNEAGRTIQCPKCGEEASSEMKFCPRCGAALRVTAKPSVSWARERRPQKPDVLGLVSAGVILIIIALAYTKNPIEPSVVISYFERMGRQGTFIKPPLGLFDLAIFFFYAVGVWGIVLSGLRIIFERNVRRALGDLIGGFFAFYCAFLATSYANDVFAGRATLAYFFVGIGLVIVVNTIIHFAFQEKWLPMQPRK